MTIAAGFELRSDEEQSSRVVMKLVRAIVAKAAEIERLEATLGQLRMELANQASQFAGVLADEAAFIEMVTVLRALAEASR